MKLYVEEHYSSEEIKKKQRQEQEEEIQGANIIGMNWTHDEISLTECVPKKKNKNPNDLRDFFHSILK